VLVKNFHAKKYKIMLGKNLIKKISNFLDLKELGKRILSVIILTLTAVFTVYIYAAFIEPTAGPNDSDQDFVQNILGANNADNDFDSSLVTASSMGSIIEILEYAINSLYSSECGESTTSTKTNCYVDDTVRYLTTDLCNEVKENQCFISTDNGYYAFGTECSDSTTTTNTNCYIDDTAKYVDSSACSTASNSGYCYINTATFSAMDSDLTAANIKNGVTIFGVTGSLASAKDNPDYPDMMHIASFIEPSSGPSGYNQDFTQNVLGANNSDNDFDSSNVVANRDGSIIERAKYINNSLDSNYKWYSSECGESTTSSQTSCHVDDTARYLTTNLCDSAKENSCFVPTNNNYYAFGIECSDSTTSTQTNCYIDDTARYVASNVCSAASNDGYCYINTANLSDIDTDLIASNIKYGVTIFGVTGTKTLANGSSCSSAAECTSGYCVDGTCCNNSCSGSTCQRCDSYSNAGAGTCGYVSSSVQDPDGECPGAFGTCASTNCSGSGYTCGYLSGQQACTACTTCNGSSFSCTNSAAGSQPSGCTGCYYCNDSGSCVLCKWEYQSYSTGYWRATGNLVTCTWAIRGGNPYRLPNVTSGPVACTTSLYDTTTYDAAAPPTGIFNCLCN